MASNPSFMLFVTVSGFATWFFSLLAGIAENRARISLLHETYTMTSAYGMLDVCY
jgi:hypothetical protein